jgi:O-antigen/teichoic acid export membrane protein
MTVPSEPSKIGSRALTGAAWMVGFRMCSRLLGVASTLVLARLLNTADFGIVAIAFTISAALDSVSNVGVTENLVRHKQAGRDVLDTGFTIQVIKGLICGVLVAAAAPLASQWYDDPRLQNVLYVLGGAFALSGFENVGIVYFRRDLRFDREFQLSSLERVSMFVVTLISALVLRNYWALVIGTATAKVVRLLATYAMHPYRPRLGLRAWHELAGFSFWMWLSSLAYIVWRRADPLVVGAAVTKAELGVFVVALDIALLPTTEILDALNAVLFAQFSAERNEGGDPRRNAFRLALTLVAIMAPIALILSAASTDVVGVLLGAKWSAASPVVAILTFSSMLSPFSLTASIVLTSMGKLKSNFLVVSLASIAKLAVLSFAARTGSLHMIAIAALTITSIESSLFIFMLRRNGSQIRGIAGPLGRLLPSLLASALAMYASGLAWAGDAVLPLTQCVLSGIALGIIGGGTYAAGLLGLWHAAGRPDGPEQQIVDVGLPILTRLWQRLAGLLGRKPADVA